MRFRHIAETALRGRERFIGRALGFHQIEELRDLIGFFAEREGVLVALDEGLPIHHRLVIQEPLLAPKSSPARAGFVWPRAKVGAEEGAHFVDQILHRLQNAGQGLPSLAVDQKLADRLDGR